MHHVEDDSSVEADYGVERGALVYAVYTNSTRFKLRLDEAAFPEEVSFKTIGVRTSVGIGRSC